MTIDRQPSQPQDGSDWIAWLKTASGTHIMVQIGYQADEAEANKIVSAMAAIEA